MITLWFLLNAISTGSASLDKMLSGGVRIGMLTDVFGTSGSGKTQLCFQLCVNCTKPIDKNGLNASVLFIDTSHTFRPERIVSIAGKCDIGNNILDKIYVYKVHSVADQIAAIKHISRINNLKLVIVDSITDLFSFEYKESLSVERHMKFMRLMHELALLAIKCDTAVVVTNNIRFSESSQREYLGRSISSFAHVKIELTKDNELLKAKLLQPVLRPRSEFYQISERGITDV